MTHAWIAASRSSISPAGPIPSAKLWRESAHGTLGHLTACQSAWIPIIRGLRDGVPQVVIPINPDPLYRQFGFKQLPWKVLLDRFASERDEWRRILGEVDVKREIRTAKRVYTAQIITKRLVDHEHRHLEELGSSNV